MIWGSHDTCLQLNMDIDRDMGGERKAVYPKYIIWFNESDGVMPAEMTHGWTRQFLQESEIYWNGLWLTTYFLYYSDILLLLFSNHEYSVENAIILTLHWQSPFSSIMRTQQKI